LSDHGYDHLAQRIQAVIDAQDDRLDMLVKATGLDPKTDLRFGDWSGLDLSGADLRGFNFTGADLTGTRFDNALIAGATFDNASYELASLEKAADFYAFQAREEAAAPIFNRLALVGCGLIGSSIARAARQQYAVRSIVATSRSDNTRRRIIELGFADRVVETSAAAVEGADLVILSIPLAAYAEVIQQIAPLLARGATVSDVGSVKASVLREMEKYLPANVHFVPAHPFAGTEYSGPDAGFSELFIDRWCILTPPKGTDAAAISRLAAFWRRMGANTETMTAEHHDLVVAMTSHLPHLLASNMIGVIDRVSKMQQSEVLKFSAGDLRDFTQITLLDPTDLPDAFLTNKDAVLEMLGNFQEGLSALTRAIRRSDGQALFDYFTRVRAIRRGIVEIGYDSEAPDFGLSHHRK
jgi:cyclohexadieny/prephenate dehydrogenase